MSPRWSFTRFRERWGRKPPPRIPVVVDGIAGEVPEWARQQAAANMRLDPAKKAEVVALLEAQHPGRGEALARERYREAFED